MIPIVAAQLHATIEGLRLLEVLVTAPLGLNADIRMLRQAVPLAEAADLSREEDRERRAGYRGLTADPILAALHTIEQLSASVTLFESVRDGADATLTAEWADRACRVLDRAQQRVGSDLRAHTASRIAGLYVIVDPEVTRGRPVSEVAEAALVGGASVIQLQDKTQAKGDVLDLARQLKLKCEEHHALFIINGDPSVALSSGAHGLHVGQNHIPVTDARRVLNHAQIVGRLNNTMEEVADSQAIGVDYLAIGAVYPTSTMGKNERPAVGVEMVSSVKERATQPVVAIGGITRDNIGDVARAGADCICVASAVTLADDPEASARELVEAIQNVKS